MWPLRGIWRWRQAGIGVHVSAPLKAQEKISNMLRCEFQKYFKRIVKDLDKNINLVTEEQTCHTHVKK